MRTILALAILLVATTALSLDLGGTAPTKVLKPGPAPAVDPEVQRQGGDTFADAVPIPLQYEITGSTVGYADDYDEVCPYDGSTSPDVVYTVTPGGDAAVNIDLYGSSYDTKLYVYDIDLNLIACNDDYYPDYTSKLENVYLLGGMQYYIVIDGYGNSAGDNNLYITDYWHCILDCPIGAELEGEPPLVDGYVDEYNQGCQGGTEEDFQHIDSTLFCGKTGYYISEGGGGTRDGDYFILTIDDDGILEVIGDAEERTYMFECGPQDCATFGVIQSILVGPCQEEVMTIYGVPGSEVWFLVLPYNFYGGDTYEYNYLLSISESPSAVEPRSLTGIKSLFHDN